VTSPPAPPAPARPAIAVILARAGSKGVPGKNVAEVGGRPCIAWTIEAARRARTVGCVVVSTDDPRAGAIAKQMESAAIERPPELASDTARVDDAARHAVRALPAAAFAKSDGGGGGPSRTPIVILYANVPVRPEGLIDRAVELFLSSGCDSVQSYSPVGKHHPWWTARLDSAGAVSPWEGDVLNHGVYRRQDLPPAFIPDGGVLVVSRAALFGELPGVPPGPHAFFGRDRRGIISESEVIDIDSPRDLLVADAALRSRYAEGAESSQRAQS
jgi:CMP-N,N'-diacetyllegionaminic acid synthase